MRQTGSYPNPRNPTESTRWRTCNCKAHNKITSQNKASRVNKMDRVKRMRRRDRIDAPRLALSHARSMPKRGRRGHRRAHRLAATSQAKTSRQMLRLSSNRTHSNSRTSSRRCRTVGSRRPLILSQKILKNNSKQLDKTMG